MKPNILYMVCHDLGAQLPIYGDTTIPSPHLDRLSAEGVTFLNHFAASTPCSPSRGCIMTGRYAHCNRLIGLVNRGWDMPDEEQTIVDHLNRAGFHTYHFGLQHERKGTERNRFQHEWTASRRSDQVADQVIYFLRSEAARAQPFYVNVGVSEVHLPFDRPEYIPDDPEAVYVPPYLPDTPDVRLELARFHGAVRFMDQAVGRILSALKETGLAENTVVIFTTDHGFAFPRAKSTLYDPGIRTTLILRCPEGMVRNGRYTELISNIDLTPTLLEMVGVEVPDSIQGRSFYGLLTEGPYEKRREVFSEKNFHDCYDPIRCIRTDQYKYIRSFEQRTNLPLPADIERSIASNTLRPDAHDLRPIEELYDLQVDPWEENNLISDPAYAAVWDDLRTRLQRWMEETDDPILKGNPLPHPPEQAV